MKYYILAIALLTSATTFAEDSSRLNGFYVGGTLGLTEYDEGGYFDNSVLVGSSFDDESIGLGVFGGYAFNKWFALETSFTALGDYLEEGRNQNDDDEIETALSALTFSAVASIPMGKVVSLYFQAGFGLGFVAQTIDYDVPGVDIEEDETDSGAVTQLGAGLKINIPGNVQIRTGYQRFSFDADLAKINQFNLLVDESVDQDIDYLFVGASYQF